MNNSERSNLGIILGTYEESFLHLRGFAALLDRNMEIDSDVRDEVSALLAHLMRSHNENTKKLVAVIENRDRS